MWELCSLQHYVADASSGFKLTSDVQAMNIYLCSILIRYNTARTGATRDGKNENKGGYGGRDLELCWPRKQAARYGNYPKYASATSGNTFPAFTVAAAACLAFCTNNNKVFRAAS